MKTLREERALWELCPRCDTEHYLIGGCPDQVKERRAAHHERFFRALEAIDKYCKENNIKPAKNIDKFDFSSKGRGKGKERL